MNPKGQSLAHLSASQRHPRLTGKTVLTVERRLGGRLSGAELKGWMNRTLRNIILRNAKGAGDFLRVLRNLLAGRLLE